MDVMLRFYIPNFMIIVSSWMDLDSDHLDLIRLGKWYFVLDFLKIDFFIWIWITIHSVNLGLDFDTHNVIGPFQLGLHCIGLDLIWTSRLNIYGLGFM